MDQLKSQISSLYAQAHELLYLGTDGSPIYSDHFCNLNRDVLRLADSLYTCHGATDDEEAQLCLSLLAGYNATIYNHGDKEERIQHILDRCWDLLERLPASLLKVRLLTYCYGEVFDEDLAREADTIIGSWSGKELSKDEQEIIEYLENLKEHPYPNWEMED